MHQGIDTLIGTTFSLSSDPTIAKQMEAFLKKGGEIQLIPLGVSAIDPLMNGQLVSSKTKPKKAKSGTKPARGYRVPEGLL